MSSETRALYESIQDDLESTHRQDTTPRGTSLLPSIFILAIFLMFGYLALLCHEILRNVRVRPSSNLLVSYPVWGQSIDSLKKLHDEEPLSTSKGDGVIQVLIAYGPSNDPYQELMAQQVAQGVRTQNPDLVIRMGAIEELSFNDVLASDAVIVGASVENANTHHEVQKWINENWKITANLSHKIGAAFVTAGGMSVGEEGTLQRITQSMMVFNMIIVGGDTWSAAFGASAVTYEEPFGHQTPVYFDSQCAVSREEVIHPLFLAKAVGLGRRVAQVVSRFNNPC